MPRTGRNAAGFQPINVAGFLMIKAMRKIEGCCIRSQEFHADSVPPDMSSSCSASALIAGSSLTVSMERSPLPKCTRTNASLNGWHSVLSMSPHEAFADFRSYDSSLTHGSHLVVMPLNY
jgi:hypothetical protein